MSDNFVGEIRMFGGNFAPLDWAFCNGQSMDISQNDVLYSLIGTTYGGDGQVKFNLPDLQSRLPMHMGTVPGLTPRIIGQFGGVETVAITEGTMPQHSHPFYASTNAGNATAPANTKVLGQIAGANTPGLYTATATSPVAMNAQSVTSSYPGGMPHDNLMPALCVSFIIALNGIYPSRS
jgi:microcystin-dependent protein